MQIPSTTSGAPETGTIVYAGANPQAAKKVLGQEDFMKLLSTQLSAQDPMNPMKDTEFIAQMASFSSLDQSRQLNASFATFNQSQSLLSAGNLLGRTVTVEGANGQTITGKVDAAALSGGVPTVLIQGVSYPLSQISRIATSN